MEKSKQKTLIISIATLFVIAVILSLANPIRSMGSFEEIEGFPIYSMTYYGNIYDRLRFTVPQSEEELKKYSLIPAGMYIESQACTLFSATGGDEMIYGRNRDLSDQNKALIVFTAPPGGYRSISIVDLNQMGIVLLDDQVELGFFQRIRLLVAPLLPTEGMNEYGLTIAKADLSTDDVRPFDPAKESLFFRTAMREVLDHAKTTKEAVELLNQYNIAFGTSGGHFLIADPSGDSVIVEYYDDQVNVLPSPEDWQVMTNFSVGQLEAGEESGCERYKIADASLEEVKGEINPEEAMEILEDVSVSGTLWSVVYNMTEQVMDIALYGNYADVLQVAIADW